MISDSGKSSSSYNSNCISVGGLPSIVPTQITAIVTATLTATATRTPIYYFTSSVKNHRGTMAVMIILVKLLRYYNQWIINRTLQLHTFLHLYSSSGSSILVEVVYGLFRLDVVFQSDQTRITLLEIQKSHYMNIKL